MNTDERILQILENSACLSKGQLLGYVKHTLYPEELRAVELHLSSCAFCNDALDGMALQADPDKLLASLVPPPLPVISPKEKAREKKEQAAAREEKTAPVQARVPVAKPDNTHAETDSSQRLAPRRNNFLKPLGIAAALALGFGAFWYFELRPDRDQKKLAAEISERDDSVRDNPAAADQQMIAAENRAVADTTLKSAAKKQKDSLLIAKKEDARRQSAKDSMAKLLAAAPAIAANEAAAKGSRKEAETTGVADEQTVKNAVAAAPALARKEEDQATEGKEKKKATLSDYELGMQQYKQKNYASALLYFKTAESDKGDPRHWDAVYYSALCNRNLNKDRKARKLLERIVDAGAPQKKSAQKQLDDMEKEKKK